MGIMKRADDMKILWAGLLMLAALTFSSGSRAAPGADLWDRWVPDGSAEEATINHAPWDAFLKRFVKPGADGINRVDYEQVKYADRVDLNNYVSALTASQPSKLPRSEAKAYWINLYNALTVQTVLRHYPVETIRDIDTSPGLFSNGPWGAEQATIEGTAVTLDDIEHRILRPIWNDPLVHYALNCAAVGCPQLQAEAFVPNRMNQQLSDSAHAFINHPRAIRFSDTDLSVSSIYVWFMEDFGATDRDVIDHIRQFADPVLQQRLSQFSRISGDFYDWSLNDTSPVN
jgi:hypothetical protein